MNHTFEDSIKNIKIATNVKPIICSFPNSNINTLKNNTNARSNYSNKNHTNQIRV